MDFVFLLFILAVLVCRWLYLRQKFQEMHQKVEELQAAVRRMEWNGQFRPAAAPAPAALAPAAAPPGPTPASPPTAPLPFVDPPREHPRADDFLLQTKPPVEAQPRVEAEPPAAAQPRVEAEPPAVDWELVVGGNWMQKIGVLVSIMALAFLLQYAWVRIGPAGRVALSYAASFTMLGGGVWAETRERFRNFGYGLIGGGWAALYLTTYSMYGIPEAKILDSALAASALLLLVALGMIAHSLKYRSQTVSALAAFIAFFSLAISDVTSFSVVALIPLAAALLYIAYRNQWSRFAFFGLLATYITCGLHKDTGAPLWQTQSLFLAYWLLFEAFDLLRADPWLLPMNAVGFLALSAGKWQHAAPDQLWQLAAGASAIYLISTILRVREDRWRPAITLNAALATAAILLKLHDQWAPLWLLVLAELYYLAGVRWNSRWLRGMAACLFTLEVGHLLIEELDHIALRTWEPVAIGTIAVFYLNRALRAGDVVYGYVAAGLGILVTGLEATAETVGRVWTLLALAPFSFGWWRRQLDFRVQGYGLAVIGAIATALYAPHPPVALAIGATVAYAFVHCTLWSAEDRFGEQEREALRLAASLATSLGLGALVWKLVPGDYLGIAWLALAVVLLEAGLLKLPVEFRWQAYIMAVLGVTRVVGFDLNAKLVLVSAGLSYLLAFRSQNDENGRLAGLFAFPGTLFLMAGLLAVLPEAAVSPAWALVALALAEFGHRTFKIQAIIVSAAVFVRCVTVDFDSSQVLLSVIPVIACYAATVLRHERGSYLRLYYSLMSAGLAASLIYNEVSGSVLTIAWGLEGVALLGAGFPLGDRVLRLSGLALLAGCIGKLFIWDLRNLETLPRIFSFIVLGALLVGVSWVYTRFRERVQQYL